MAHFPIGQQRSMFLSPRSYGGDRSLSEAVISPQTANTVGAWRTICEDSGPGGASWMYLWASVIATSNTDNTALLDIAFGDAGSEVIVVEGLPCGQLLNIRNFSRLWQWPLRVPPGVRIAARIQAGAPGTVGYVGVTLFDDADHPGYSTCIAYGVDRTVSSGTALPAAANTTSFSDTLGFTLTHPCRWLHLSAQVGTSGNVVAMSNTWGLIRLRLHTDTICEVPFGTRTDETTGFTPVGFPVSLPAGADVYVQYLSTATTAVARPDVTVHALY